jgi:hypothetical protein
MTLHPTLGCATCHDASVRQAVKDAITSHNRACAACHTFTDHNTLHTVTRTDTCVGAACHAASNTSLMTLHPTLGCATCHASTVRQAVKDAITSHNRACAACHTFTDHTTQHAVTRTDTCVGATCHAASNANLTTLHPTLGCATCHDASVRQTVKDAITNHNKACAACHTFTDHTALHAVTRSDTCVGAGCHDASNANLTTLHPTLGCNTCHASTVRQAVKDAITSHNKACSACHVTDISSLTLHPRYVTLHNTTGNGCTGTYCHPATALTIHGRTGCVDSCHKNPVVSLTLNCGATCHVGDGLTAHVAVHAYCNGCHNGWPGNSYGHSPPSYEPEAACTNCHTGTPGSSTSQVIGQPHDYDYGCSNCHE